MKLSFVSNLLSLVAASSWAGGVLAAEEGTNSPAAPELSAPATPSVPLGHGAGKTSAPSHGSSRNKKKPAKDKGKDKNGECYTPQPIPQLNGTTDITNIGMILFPGFDPIDVFGTLESLQLLSMGAQKLNLFLVAESMEPVYSGLNPAMNKFGSNFGQKVLPTNTFDDLTDTLDVLYLPGGPGSEAPDTTKIEAFIKAQLPQVKIFASVCTGARIAAKAGVLDGIAATTNKKAWAGVTKAGPNVNWIAPARFVRDGKIWTASGVTSGIDLVYSLISTYWGKTRADSIMGAIEHVPRDAMDDPFTEINKVTPTGNLCKEKK